MWYSYNNGNYKVYINSEDGSKYRFTEDNEFIAEIPESMDIKITNFCERGCLFCHENSSKEGKHAELNQDFINSLSPYQEVAIGGGNVLTHPDLKSFLNKLKEKKIIPSITINQEIFLKHYQEIKELYDNKLIYGIGVSLTDSSNFDLIYKLTSIPTTVIHAINGIFTEKDLYNLKDKNLKILFLGYKNIRRGKDYYNEEELAIKDKQNWLKTNIDLVYDSFEIVSFDNLAIEQLKVEDSVDKEIWDSRYMGDDGDFTFFIDMVEKEFAKSSTSTHRYKINDNSIKDMFSFIRLNN